MTVVAIISIAFLGLAACLTLYRMVQGPTTLDRVVAVDVLLAVVIASLGIYSVASHTSTALPMVLVLSLIGFSSAVSVAQLIEPGDIVRRRFDERREEES